MSSITIEWNPLRTVGPRVAPRLPDGWEHRAPTRFTLTPVAPTIGAWVEGVSIAFAANWGPLETHPFATAALPGQRSEAPQVLRLAKDDRPR